MSGNHQQLEVPEGSAVQGHKLTKHVRIENADTSSYKVKVLVQERLYDVEQQRLSDDWTVTKTFNLDYPTALITDYLTSTKRFLIIEEE